MSKLARLGASSPFDNNHADPWAKSFVDVPSLNAPVTDAIAGAITRVRTAGRKDSEELRTSSLLVLGPAGAGKTHLFARLRHKLGPKAVFVHLRPLVGTEMTPRYVLGQIVQQLGYETMGQADQANGLKQLEALVGSSLALLDGESPDYPRLFLSEVARLDDAKRAEKLEAAVELLLDRHQEADETYLARLLETPFMKPPQQRAALAWLSGRELEDSQMKRLGVSANLPEERIIQALQTLGVFAAPGAPIVLVFDQLENLMDAEATGARIRAYANLVAELFDTTRGLVLVQMALDSEWERAILPQLSAAQKTRLSGSMSVIALPNAAQIRELVAKWTELLPDRMETFPWPFGEKRIDVWSHTPGMTPRMLMTACKQALALGPDAPVDEAEAASERPASEQDVDRTDAALAAAWDEHVSKARRALDEAADDRRSADVARVAGGVACAMALVGGFESTRVDAKQSIQLHTRLRGTTIALALLHQTNPRSAISALDRAAEATSKGRVIVLRERALDFPPTWKKVQASIVALVARGAGWLAVERDDAAHLLALESFLAAARSRDLEDGSGRALEPEVVKAWIDRTRSLVDWPVIRALLGEATEDGDVPTSIVERSTSMSAGALAATIRTCLTQLRVVSLERLVREVFRVKPDAGRTEVVATLEELASEVRWFGRTVVATKSEEARS